MDKRQPLISVITVCYNSAETIEQTIKSVLGQTYTNFEYWIIDGCSQDDTLKIVKSYEDAFQGKLHIVSEKDNGIYDAMNKGIRLSQGILIGILNSDDYYSNNTLELVAERYEKENYPLIVINGDMIRVDQNGNEIFRYRFNQSNIDNKEYFGHPSMFAAKAVYDRVGLYDESYKLAADGEWQYRVHEDEQIRYVLCNQVFNHMREGGASDSPKYRWKWFKERTRLKRKYKKGNRLKIFLQELFAVIRTDIKAIVPKKFHSKLYKIIYRKSLRENVNENCSN